MDDQKTSEEERQEKIINRAKQLNRVICICKGIKLSQIMDALGSSETVAEVNRKAGTGQGGCKGERCGPKIKILLRKMDEKRQAKSRPQGEAPNPSPDESDDES